MLRFAGIVDLFADAVVAWGKSVAHLSRLEGVKTLRGYWFEYLAESGLESITLAQLDEQLMAGYRAWLFRQLKADGKPLNPNTVNKALGAVRILFKSSPSYSKWLEMVPAGSRGGERKAEPTEVLRFDQLLQVMEISEKRVQAIHERWNRGKQLIERGRSLLAAGKSLWFAPGSQYARTDENLSLALAMLDKSFPGIIPDLDQIEKHDALLAETIQRGIGLKEAARFFYASAEDLVPCVICLAVATVFNPDTVLCLRWGNIDRQVDRLKDGGLAVQIVDDDGDDGEGSEVLEPKLVKIAGDKPRARRQLVRLLDPESNDPGQVSLNLILDLLHDMTARIRPLVIDKSLFGDRVFLFVQKSGAKRPKGFGGPAQAASTDTTWQYSFGKFIADNNLPDFTLKTIRATLLDYTQLFNRGDLEAAQQVGNHKSRVTTWTHYTSNLVRRLLQEAVGETLLVRERWLDTDGKLDPRKHREWSEKGCATPGWVCLDPFDSPRPNQRKGRLCRAYGECPDCPLGAARPYKPRNVALYEALRRAIYRSAVSVTVSVWRVRWAPVVVALDGLLAKVPTNVLQESRKLNVELPDVG